jgi:hypothetical protein
METQIDCAQSENLFLFDIEKLSASYSTNSRKVCRTIYNVFVDILNSAQNHANLIQAS